MTTPDQLQAGFERKCDTCHMTVVNMVQPPNMFQLIMIDESTQHPTLGQTICLDCMTETLKFLFNLRRETPLGN